MSKYLTPQAYRRFDADGLPLTNVSDLVLARYIARSEAAIDAYVGFDTLAGGFEPHVIGLVQQGFDMTGGFGARKLRFPSPLVPVRNIQRIQIHISNASPSGEPLLAILSPGEVIINNWDGYCECIALTLTYSLSAVIWELGANPPLAEWDVAVGHYLPYWGETLWDNGDGLSFYAVPQFWAQTYEQAASAQPAKLPAVPPTIYVNGAPQPFAVLAQPLVAGQAYTSLPVTALATGFTNGTPLILNDGRGVATSATGAVIVTLSAGVSAGAVALPVTSFTPAVAYPAGTVLASGYSVNYTEGGAIFATSQAGKTITADFTGQLWPLVQEAAIDQVTYLLQQRALNQAGMGGLEQARSADFFARRSRTDDTEEDQLCAKARMKLAAYKPVAIG